ncbi:MAG: hypothetical protein DHS20C15_33740 [Planctomycetota bacterium]|nr:MAG: hypothetical protein DHS20C15_33740 [Planctomycetota bacterium]
MTAASDSRRTSVALPLRLYVGIVGAYVALIGWWVYFFSRLGDNLAAQLAANGRALDPEQASALRAELGRTARMFLFEGGFLGLLLLASVMLVLRSLRREVALGQQQRNFVSAVTHELRSPLASIKLYLESLATGRATGEKAARYVSHAQQDVERLESMVEDVLTTRQLDEGRLRAQLVPLDLAAWVREACARLGERYTTEGVTLRLNAPAPAPVNADEQALLRILDNLVSNAVKYGGEGGVVEVGVSSQGGRVELSVRDHGVGLPEGEAAALTEPFVRGGDEQVRTRPGVGLGLFIVRELVAAHGGRLRLRSASAGAGTCAVVELPRAAELAS